jgi:hypothetical protein
MHLLVLYLSLFYHYRTECRIDNYCASLVKWGALFGKLGGFVCWDVWEKKRVRISGLLFDVHVTVHSFKIRQGKEPTRCNTYEVYSVSFGSTCFGHRYGHHQGYSTRVIKKDGLSFLRLYFLNWVHLFESSCIVTTAFDVQMSLQCWTPNAVVTIQDD